MKDFQATLVDLPQSTCKEEQQRWAVAGLTNSGKILWEKFYRYCQYLPYMMSLTWLTIMPYLPDGESPWQSASTTSCVQQAKREIKQLFWNLLVLMSLDTGMLGVTSRFNTTQSVFAALLFFWEGTTLQSRCTHFFHNFVYVGPATCGVFSFCGVYT